MKGSIYQKDIIIISIHASNNKVLKYMKQKLTRLKIKLDISTIIWIFKYPIFNNG